MPRSLPQWLKHAFEVESNKTLTPTPEQVEAVDFVCREIVRRRMTTPSLMFLEMSRPLNFVSSQAMHFFAPFVSVLTEADGYRHFAAFLEKRGSIDYICQRIEELEATCEDPKA